MSSFSDFVTKIVMPFMALFLGLFANGWWANQTLSVQELALAIQVKGSDKQDGMTLEWAEKTIAQYTRSREATPAPPAPGDYYPVSKEIADNVCLFPHSEIRSLPPFFLDTAPENELIGQNAKVLLFKSVSAYRDARRRYDSVMKLLKDGCGFLPRIDKLSRDKE